ncbi:MAG: class I SAM-dependent methyltransferase [Patescibacteria group bacterium]|nr:class I SAM-dependent methyltransferase [Patescibacteria group bacterium]
MSKTIPKHLIDHYKLEKHLATQLRSASRSERLILYRKLYDELYTKVPSLKTNPRTVNEAYLKATVRTLRPFLQKDTTYLEVGAGNLATIRGISALVKKTIAIDVSKEFATALGPIPKNCELIISNGISIPAPKNSVDIAYSTQLMEHLHPDDAEEQLRNVFVTLKKGGRYVLETPHRFNGPHDISKYFDDEATGFHLHEYTNRELRDLFRTTGFRKIYNLIGAKGYHLPCPTSALIALESLLNILPKSLRRALCKFLPIKILLGIKIIGVK